MLLAGSILTSCSQPDSLAILSQQLGTQFVHQAGHQSLAIGIVHRGKLATYCFGGCTSHSIYELASVSKTFTGLLLAHALLEGRLRLTDPVQHYLDQPFPNLTAHGQPVTIGQLATHTAGFPKFIPAPLPGVPIAQTVTHYASFSRQQFLDSLARVRLASVPGTAFQYSDADVQLLGIILENVYRTSYADLLRRYITAPQHMPDTGLEVAPADSSRFLPGYDAQGRRMPRLVWWRQTPAAGYLKSTAADMLRYLQLNLREQDPAVRLSHQLHSAVPTDQGDGMGLLWFRAPAGPTQRLYHAGGGLGAMAFCVVDPAQQAGVVVLTNEADAQTEPALQAMATRLLQAAAAAK